jgi:acylphosphatase
MANLTALNMTIRGRVQGVSFRYFAKSRAISLGLSGWVRNMPEGNAVQVVAEGEKEALTKLAEALKTGPQGARVDETTEIWGEYSGAYTGFRIEF